MEDEGGLNFDFEGGLETAPVALSQPQQTVVLLPASQETGMVVSSETNTGASKVTAGRKNYRQTVCRHWLRGLCMKGDACGFLHQYDKARMPVCRFFAKFGECREHDCIYKHTNEDIKECNMYKLGFCPNGPDCRYRHQKVLGPPPPIEQNLQKLQHRVYAINGGAQQGGRYLSSQPSPGVPSRHSAGDGDPWPHRPAGATGGDSIPAAAPDDSHNVQHSGVQRPIPQVPKSVSPPSQPVECAAENALPDASVFTSAAIPLPKGHCRFFIVKSSNRENLELSVQRGLWATHRNNESKLNDAYDTCHHVILIFSVNETRHIQGCARMMSKIEGVVGGGGWKYAHGTAHYGRNFRLKWLKLCELSFNKTRHLRNPYNENLPVKISRDCQELEPSVGEQLAQLLYVEPDSGLMILAKAGEEERGGEERVGLGFRQKVEDPAIISFEDNKDEKDDRVDLGSRQKVEDPAIISSEDNEDEQDDDDSDDEEESFPPIVCRNTGRGRGPVGSGQPWGPFGMARRGMVSRTGPAGRGMGLHPDVVEGGFRMNFDRFGGPPGEIFGMAPADMFGGYTGGQGRGFPPFARRGPVFPGGDFLNMGPGVCVNYGPMDGPGTGMAFRGGPPPPNGMFPLSGPPMMGPPGGRTQRTLGGGSRPLGRSPRPLCDNFRQFSGSSGRRSRGAGDQHKRRRIDRSSGNDGLATGGDEASPNMKPVEPAEDGGQAQAPEGFFSAANGHKDQDDSGYGMTAYTRDDDDDSESVSEDEAPRRSRYGGAKKRRRDEDVEDNGANGVHWNQVAEQGVVLEPPVAVT